MGFLPALPRAVAGTVVVLGENGASKSMIWWLGLQLPWAPSQSPPTSLHPLAACCCALMQLLFVLAFRRSEIDIRAYIVPCAPYGGVWSCSWLAVPR